MLRAFFIFFVAFLAFQAKADCFEAAAKQQHISTVTLRAIAFVESTFNPKAIHRNKNGTYDYGIMQINSTHLKELKKFKIGVKQLMNECINIRVAAWILRRKINYYGYNYKAVAAYHTGSLDSDPKEALKYGLKVMAEVDKLQQKQKRIYMASR